MRNANLLEADGVHIVPKERCHDVWKILCGPDSDEKPKLQLYQDFLEGCLKGCDAPDIRQIVIFHPAILDGILGTIRGGDILPRIRFISRVYLKCIPQENLMFSAAVRSPSKFIPALYARRLSLGHLLKFEEFLHDINPEIMLWSSTWSRLIVPYKELHPDDAPVYVWRYEDYPGNWREVLSAITGHQSPEDFSKSDEPLAPEISLYGAALFAHYIEDQSIKDKRARKEAFKLFRSDYPDDGTIIKDEIWTPELIQTLNDAYSDDWYFLEQMDHVVTI